MRVAIGLLLVASWTPRAHGQDGATVGPPRVMTFPFSDIATAGFPEYSIANAKNPSDEQSIDEELESLIKEEMHWVAPHNPLTIDVQKRIAVFKNTPLYAVLLILDVVQSDGGCVLVACDKEHHFFKLSCDEKDVSELMAKMHEADTEVRVVARCLMDNVQTEYPADVRMLTISRKIDGIVRVVDGRGQMAFDFMPRPSGARTLTPAPAGPVPDSPPLDYAPTPMAPGARSMDSSANPQPVLTPTPAGPVTYDPTILRAEPAPGQRAAQPMPAQ